MKSKCAKLWRSVKSNKILTTMFVVFLLGLYLLAAKVVRAGAVLSNGDLTSYTLNGLNNSIVPDPSQFTKGRDIYMEISQPGAVSSLNASDTWAKIYVDADRLSSAVVGVYAGAFTGCGVDYAAAGCLGRSSDVQFEFYGASNVKPDKSIPEFIDDGRCPNSFKTINGGVMHDAAWDVIKLGDYLDKGCGGDTRNLLAPTKKTGKVVIFVHAKWLNSGSDRTNAFKVGGAYTDNKAGRGSALAGYWSPYDIATNASPSGFNPSNQDFSRGEYAVQDRVGTNKSEQGNYVFAFGPDCYLSKDQPDPKTRYIKWYDVDLDFYKNLSSQPYFELFDKTANSPVQLTDVDSGAKYTTVSGLALGGKNKFKQMSFQGKGGHLYAWRWKNVVQRDGIVFWMPYDDFPSLNNGCGEWSHELQLKAGVQGVGTADFSAYGGQTITANLSQIWSGKDAGPNTSALLNMSSENGKSIISSVESLSTTYGGQTSVASTNQRQLKWDYDDLGRLGPAPAYSTSRPNIFAYFKLKEDAVDGARYCFTASMAPHSNIDSKSIDASVGGVLPGKICVTINNSLRPYLTTSGADVHAGDCTISSATNGKITGQGVDGSVRGSSGSYIVSAGDAITKFGSGGSPGGTSLTFGKTGRYGTMCRPSLADLQAELAKGGFTTIAADSAVPYDLSRLASGSKYLVYFNGPGTVVGKSSAPVTVYSTGTLTIAGSDFGSQVSASTSRTNLPVVGVIAQDIKIKKEVNGITAQLYATGTIDTCSDATTVTCRSTLLLRGFAMAHDFSFKRSGTGSNGLQLAELFNFNAAFYLNPPPGFGSAAGAVKYLGERAPLY